MALWGAAPVWADLADDIIGELRCPAAGISQPLATAESPEAAWMRGFIRAKVSEGWSKQRIVDTLVYQYGERVMAEPAKEGFSLAAWLAPFATIFGGAGVVGTLLTRWLRARKLHDAYLNAEIVRASDEADLRRYEEQLLRELEQFE
jgi:cytochrome c-type biogenesis protein CcmH